MAVIAMIEQQLSADDSLHQTFYEFYQNSLLPNAEQLAYLKTLQLFNEPDPPT